MVGSMEDQVAVDQNVEGAKPRGSKTPRDAHEPNFPCVATLHAKMDY